MQPLSLDQALSKALAHSPYLSAFAQEIEARKAEVLQAGLLPNPEFTVEMENAAGSGEFSRFESAETTVWLSQLVGLGGKRGLNREVASLDQKLAGGEYEVAKTELIARTTDRFITILSAQERLGLAGEQVALAQMVLQTVDDAIEAGKAAAIEQMRFRSLLAEAQLQEKKAQQELAAARMVLAALWGDSEPDFSEVEGDLEDLPPLPNWPNLEAMIEKSPEAVRQAITAEAADRAVDLEQARRFPDLTVSLGLRNFQETDDNALVGEISLPLPLFDRNQGGTRAARSRLLKVQEEERSARLQLRSALVDAWQRIESSQDEIEMLREEILPALQQAFEAFRYGYGAGKFGFLEVLDGQRTLFNARSRYIDALAAYHRAVAEVERLLGRKLPDHSVPVMGTNPDIT
jgi:cobalt-zinc-cadmium efflux system outer membrane protein